MQVCSSFNRPLTAVCTKHPGIYRAHSFSPCLKTSRTFRRSSERDLKVLGRVRVSSGSEVEIPRPRHGVEADDEGECGLDRGGKISQISDACAKILIWFQTFSNGLYRTFSQKMKSKMSSQDTERINSGIRETVRSMRAFSLVLPLASVSGANAFLLITKAVSSFIKLYLLLLFLRVLLSWFPTFKWDRNPWIILRQVTDPYLNLFRGLVPPLLGTIDFTPLLGFIILQWLVGALDIGEEDRYW